jgi:hypothetical protein
MKNPFDTLSDAYDTLMALMSARTAVYLALAPSRNARKLADMRYKDRIEAAQVVYDADVEAHRADIKARQAVRINQ